MTTEAPRKILIPFGEPIPTYYASCTFRSRLEARWAVFYDAIDIPWDYEPEGFELPSGKCYLPDFWLPQQNVWMEIKPCRPSDEDLDKIREFSETVGRIILCIGQPCNPKRVKSHGTDLANHCYGDGMVAMWNEDNGYRWCACRTGRHFGVEYEARGARIDCGCPGYEIGGRGHSGDDPAILDAYKVARATKFDTTYSSLRTVSLRAQMINREMARRMVEKFSVDETWIPGLVEDTLTFMRLLREVHHGLTNPQESMAADLAARIDAALDPTTREPLRY